MKYSLGEKIRNLLAVKPLNQTDLAEKASLSISYLSLLMAEKQDNPSRSKLQGLADALDVSIDYLANDSLEEYRSWEKVAVDESLHRFIQKNDFSDEEKAGLNGISFQSSAPRTLDGWEEFWNNHQIMLRVVTQHRRRNRRARFPKNKHTDELPHDS